MFENHKAVDIVYTNRKKETSERRVVPFNVAPANIKAIDVTDLPKEDQDRLVERMVEYQAYLEQLMATAYKFEDWLELSHQEQEELKWRTFDPSNVNFL